MKTVGDLIDELENHDRDAPLLVAAQPSWPLTHLPVRVEAHPYEPDEDEDGVTRHFDPDTVWLVVEQPSTHGDQPIHPYAPQDLWEGR